MKRTTIVPLIALSLLVGSTVAMAKGAGKTFEIRKAAGAVTVDGDLKEFLSPAPKGLEIGVMNTATCSMTVGAIDDDTDLSGKFYGLYDATNIYLGFDVTDDVLNGTASDGTIWQNDCIETWWDADWDDDDTTETGSVHTDEHQLNITPIGEGEPGKATHWVFRTQDGSDLMDGVKEAAKVTKTGYTLEVSIPMAALHGASAKLKAGQVLGFNLSIVDNDTGDWNWLVWNGAAANNPQDGGMMLVK